MAAIVARSLPKQRLHYEEWLALVVQEYGSDYGYAAQHYSFRTAFDQGMTPSGAVRDCKDWLGA